MSKSLFVLASLVLAGFGVNAKADYYPQPPMGNGAIADLNIQQFCQEQFGYYAVATAVDNTVNGWRCAVEGNYYTINMSDVCFIQHQTTDARYRDFYNKDSWYCVMQNVGPGPVIPGPGYPGPGYPGPVIPGPGFPGGPGNGHDGDHHHGPGYRPVPQNINFVDYCERNFGFGTRAAFQNQDAYSWVCISGYRRFRVNFQEACNEQFGLYTRPYLVNAYDPYSWTCTR